MNRNIFLGLGVLAFLLIFGFVFYLQVNAPIESLEDQGPVEPLDSISSMPDELRPSHEGTISGALSLSEIFGLTDANLNEINEELSRREIWIAFKAGEVDEWLLVLAFPAETEVTNYSFESANSQDETTAYLLAPAGSDALAFTENAVGTINITAIEENRLSGDYSVTVAASDGSEITAEGNFANVLMVDN